MDLLGDGCSKKYEVQRQLIDQKQLYLVQRIFFISVDSCKNILYWVNFLKHLINLLNLKKVALEFFYEKFSINEMFQDDFSKKKAKYHE